MVVAPCTSNCAAARRRTLSPSFYRGRVNALVRFVVVGAVRRSRACVVRVPLASVSYFATLRTRVLHALGFWIRLNVNKRRIIALIISYRLVQVCGFSSDKIRCVALVRDKKIDVWL